MKRFYWTMTIFLFFMSMECYAQPSLNEAKKAIAEECYKEMEEGKLKIFSGYKINISIKKIGDCDSKEQFYPVCAYITFSIPGTKADVCNIDYFKLYKKESGNWIAKIVYKDCEAPLTFE